MEGWQMESLYGSVESEAFLEDVRRAATQADELAVEMQESHDIPDILSRYQHVRDIRETLEAFSSCLLSTDTTNAKYLKAMGKVEEASTHVDAMDVAFRLWVKRRWSEIEPLLQKGGALEAYRFVLEEALEEAGHLMSPDEEKLASDLNRSGTDAFSRLQDSLSATSDTSWGEGRKTGTELRGYAFSPDRELRRLAFEKELSVWKTHAPAFAACLNGVKGATITLDGRRGWKSPLERSLAVARLDRQSFEALLSTLKESLPVFWKYLALKAKVLGLDTLAFYDLFAPVGKAKSGYTYLEAQAFVIKQVSAFSPAMGSFMQDAFRKNWVDPWPHQGKVGGAYDTALPLFGESRVLANFDGTYNGVSTFAHELGHAFHDSVVMPMPNLLRSYPMTLAETASIFSEFVTLKGALAEAKDKGERLYLEDQFLQNATQVCVDILCRFLFEDEVFRLRKEGEIAVDDLNALMVRCQKETYGDLAAYHPLMWTMKSHYYSSDFSYYNYPYAFGQLFGLGLYRVYEKDPTRFEQTYVSLLKRTGSADCASVAASVGLDITHKAFWQESMEVITSFVKDFEHDGQD